jgi:hypothetical protein
LVINSSDFSPTLRLASPRGAPPGSAPAPAEINDQLIGGEHPMIYWKTYKKLWKITIFNGKTYKKLLNMDIPSGKHTKSYGKWP